MTTVNADAPTRAVVWSWPDAARGLLYAVPAAAATAVDPANGVPLALGVLPACLLPLPGPRRARLVIALVGVVCGASLFVGGALAHLPAVPTALALVAVVLAAADASARRAGGRLLLVLAAPLTAAGLSYDDWATSAAAALLLTAGATYAWAVSLLWPARPGARRPPADLPARHEMVRYGLLLGTGAGLAYLVASRLGVDHPGWAPAACLLVARPDAGLLWLRAVGRVIAVIIGALGAVAVLAAELPPAVLAVIVALVVSIAAATRASRWYITSAFTTFFVFVMLLQSHPEQASQKVGERVGETVIGVGLAVLFGIGLPALFLRTRKV
ncbi:FUSC family protein [Humibacillus xanthopallidus]|uniref:Fusaric acid resistance family protein n=1 Tax=Humibacillus xanthopallidus TaxID=412689 RepID=A0A543HHR4_9MICO|nr:FUSC family protein [Humibacillus xanthopallidus]TQM57868.1 fusaric acid resistance family protein [Humibacillus xanthopallidus]